MVTKNGWVTMLAARQPLGPSGVSSTSPEVGRWSDLQTPCPSSLNASEKGACGG